MPSHYKKKTARQAQSREKKKLTDLGTSANKNKKLKEHSKHHSSKHMAMMKKDMKSGMSFTAAHKKAQKAVGK
jgi:predicted phosphoadenosine phosphosulfate sulfurtransferase